MGIEGLDTNNVTNNPLARSVPKDSAQWEGFRDIAPLLDGDGRVIANVQVHMDRVRIPGWSDKPEFLMLDFREAHALCNWLRRAMRK